ncbi:hypothetical protein [Methylobacterium brachiatum]|uniref:hypothetical protein n=1 Tax=Methylobacterium brachiatum TaxID=269660 RepID=UPI000EFC8C4D|nr:hypothetical protein [Methylobacterium brachiatum]AYO83650.1 hypothetical protein EBB05_16175 [Methylobacterium brachiatum]
MPATYQFPAIRRGDTKTLGLFLLRRDIRSQQLTRMVIDGATIEWGLKPSGGVQAIYTDTQGLVIDRPNAGIKLPLSADQTAAMPAGPVSFFVRVTDSDGVVTTHLTGSFLLTD